MHNVWSTEYYGKMKRDGKEWYAKWDQYSVGGQHWKRVKDVD